MQSTPPSKTHTVVARRCELQYAALVPAPKPLPPRPCKEGRVAAPITRERALAELLAALLTTDELRRWLRHDPDYTDIAAKLPGSSASQEEVIDSAVAALTRVGLVDQGFLERLARDFPRRIAEIRRVAVAYGVPAPNAQATKSPTATRTRRPTASARRSNVTIHRSAKVTVGGHLAGGDIIIGGQSTPSRKRRSGG